MTSEEYFNSIVFVGFAKSRSIGSRNVLALDVESEMEYPSSMLEPQKLQGISPHFEQVFHGQNQESLPSYHLTQNKWTVSSLSSTGQIESAEILAEKVLDTLQWIPTAHKFQLYLSLLDKLTERVREHLHEKSHREKVARRSSTSRLIEASSAQQGDEYSSIKPSADLQEVPLYETVSAEEWSKLFRQWAASHRRLAFKVDDSREAIYGDRGA